jgi:hypothetical protein
MRLLLTHSNVLCSRSSNSMTLRCRISMTASNRFGGGDDIRARPFGSDHPMSSAPHFVAIEHVASRIVKPEAHLLCVGVIVGREGLTGTNVVIRIKEINTISHFAA